MMHKLDKLRVKKVWAQLTNHVHLHVDRHVSHHVGHHYVVSTLCEVSGTLVKWKSESITYGLQTDGRSD